MHLHSFTHHLRQDASELLLRRGTVHHDECVEVDRSGDETQQLPVCAEVKEDESSERLRQFSLDRSSSGTASVKPRRDSRSEVTSGTVVLLLWPQRVP